MDQFTFPVQQLAPEHYLMKRIIKMDYSDLTQFWILFFSLESIGIVTFLKFQNFS